MCQSDIGLLVFNLIDLYYYLFHSDLYSLSFYSFVQYNVVCNRTVSSHVSSIARKRKVAANERCHRIVPDSHVYSNEFHFEHVKSMTMDSLMSTMCRDRLAVASVFVIQLVDDGNVLEEKEDSMRIYYSYWL